MKELDPLLHSQLRLAVMSILMNLEEADFVYIRRQTNSTAGNLSVQIDKLAAAGYIMVDRSIVHRRSRTTCRVTPQGRQAFERYVAAIKEYLNI
ncbi:MAG: transcriptional regulator [Muribaculaceae bacterium]|nr:transcriptional regulator [Bacteroidales bacterium]MDY5387823.1 transcriptional regulator [Muribaculaceae bacterium]